MAKKHVIIHELLVGESRGAGKGDPSQLLGVKSFFDASTKTFCCNDEHKGGEGITLLNYFGGVKGSGRDPIDQNGEEGRCYQTHDPSNPRRGEAKGEQHFLNIFPA